KIKDCNKQILSEELPVVTTDYSKDEINFEEFFKFSKEINDISNLSTEPISLKEGDSFINFDEAEEQFSANIQDNPSLYIFVTTFNNIYNYDLSSKPINFEKKKQFSEEM
ncbi:6227_t:CDS:2, partial [Cetraspora pellucida]